MTGARASTVDSGSRHELDTSLRNLRVAYGIPLHIVEIRSENLVPWTNYTVHVSERIKQQDSHMQARICPELGEPLFDLADKGNPRQAHASSLMTFPVEPPIIRKIELAIEGLL